MQWKADDEAWLFKRAFVLGIAMLSHRIPSDVRRLGIHVAHPEAIVAVGTFEVIQFCIFAWTTFYVDAIPGMNAVLAFARDRRREGIRGCWRWAIVLGAIVYLVLAPLEIVRDSLPPGPPREYAAIGFFLIERLEMILVFLIATSDDDDVDPPVRRRRIVESLVRWLRVPIASTPVPVPSSPRASATAAYR